MLDERLDAIAQEFAEVEARLSSPEVSANPGLLRELSKRHKELSEVVDAYRRLKVARDDAEAARTLMAETEGSERDELRGELEGAEALILEIDEELQALLLPRDPNLGRNVIVEIRGAEGGEEANLFARDLFDMYLRYAQRRGWKLEVLEEANSEHGGLDEVEQELGAARSDIAATAAVPLVVIQRDGVALLGDRPVAGLGNLGDTQHDRPQNRK